MLYRNDSLANLLFLLLAGLGMGCGDSAASDSPTEATGSLQEQLAQYCATSVQVQTEACGAAPLESQDECEEQSAMLSAQVSRLST